MTKKEEELKNNIGDELYNQLNKKQRDFIISTSGSLDFGHPIDIDKIYELLKNDDEFYK